MTHEAPPGRDPPSVTRSRALTRDEKRVLERLLRGWEGGAEYLRQVPGLQVVGGCGCGCAAVYFETPAAQEETLVLPLTVEATIVSDVGDPLGGVLIFETGGKLTALEAYSFGDEPISTWPPNELIEVEAPTAQD